MDYFKVLTNIWNSYLIYIRVLRLYKPMFVKRITMILYIAKRPYEQNDKVTLNIGPVL